MAPFFAIFFHFFPLRTHISQAIGHRQASSSKIFVDAQRLKREPENYTRKTDKNVTTQWDECGCRGNLWDRGGWVGASKARTGPTLGGRGGGESACKPGSVADSHSSGTHVTMRLERPTRGHARAAHGGQRPPAPLFGLAPGGVYPATDVATGAVRSYRTISPLPFPFRQSPERQWRYIFCGTFRGLAPPRRYLAPCPVEPGLSSLPANGKSDCLADSPGVF